MSSYGSRRRCDLAGVDEDGAAISIVHQLSIDAWDARERLVWMAALLVDELRDRGQLTDEDREGWHQRLCPGPLHAETTFPHLVAMVPRLPTVTVVEGTRAWRGGFTLALTLDSWTSLAHLEHCATSANVRLETRDAGRLVHTFDHHGTVVSDVVERLANLGEDIGQVLVDRDLMTEEEFDAYRDALFRFV